MPFRLLLTSLVVTLAAPYAQAQSVIRIIEEGPGDASNVFADGQNIQDNWDAYDDLGRYSPLGIDGWLTKDPDPDADAYLGRFNWSASILAGWFGDNDDDRPVATFIYQNWNGPRCQRSEITFGSNRTVVYDVVPAGLREVAAGIANDRAQCLPGPYRMQWYAIGVDPTHSYTLRTLAPRPVPNEVQLPDLEPTCNSDLQELELSVDMAWFNYKDHFTGERRRRHGFWMDITDVDLGDLGFKVYTNDYSVLAVLGDEDDDGQYDDLIWYQSRDPEDPVIPDEEFQGNGASMPIGSLANYAGDRIYVWFKTLNSEGNPQEPGNPTCMRDITYASPVRESFVGLLVLNGDADPGTPSVEVSGNEATVNVTVNASAQMGCLEVRAQGPTTVVDTLRLISPANAASRWRHTSAYDTSATLVIPGGYPGDYTFTATPLTRGPYDDCSHRRDDLAVTSSVYTVANEDGPGEVSTVLGLSAYPNPLAGRGTVVVDVPRTSNVRVAVYDVLGREVAVIHEGDLVPGRRELAFDASALAPGTYVLRAVGEDASASVERITVMR